MPPLYPSPGPFPNHRALDAVGKDELRKAYYETTSNRALPSRMGSQEIRGENFLNVHNIGQRNTKYLQWTRNFAPLTTRVSCHHTQSYVPLPLGDNKINSDLAASFKKGWQQSKGGSMATMDNTTMYEDDFPGMSKKELLGARQPNRKPAQTLTQTVAPPGELLELQSHEHRHFKKPRAELAKNPRVPPPRQALEMGGAPVDPPKLTTYVREHIWLTASEPELRPTKAEKRKVQEVNMEILNIRRNPYTSPGQ
ncbi:unnamed protein product [Durusdinium trenchii]|uniref:Uncharacterized protein n=2 Tax=Durusdinium trenchii TaxID=1381693 RepID=A0ABP0S1D4_9DINO